MVCLQHSSSLILLIGSVTPVRMVLIAKAYDFPYNFNIPFKTPFKLLKHTHHHKSTCCFLDFIYSKKWCEALGAVPGSNPQYVHYSIL